MPLQYLSLKLEKPADPGHWVDLVETSLQQVGEPIRWAITSVNDSGIEIEAVVLVPNLAS